MKFPKVEKWSSLVKSLHPVSRSYFLFREGGFEKEIVIESGKVFSIENKKTEMREVDFRPIEIEKLRKLNIIEWIN